MRSFALRLLAAGFITCAWPGVGMAKIYALVIGIDQYTHISPLQGAVNDAVDIAASISNLGPEKIDVLINQEATRERILSTWGAYIDQAAPGDTIIVTFAGHGSNEAAAYPETEEDGLDETLLLAGFSPSGESAGERIRDDEIAELVERRADVQHIIVADSCHSGTATRSNSFDLGYRFYNNQGLVDDPLPPPPPPPANATNIQSQSVYFGAVGDDELAPEIMIKGSIRGALSYAFADALRGSADRDADGAITKGELEVHIRRSIKSLLDGRQKPRVDPPGAGDLVLVKGANNSSGIADPMEVPFDQLPNVKVAFIGEAPAGFDIGTLEGIEITDAIELADIVVDFKVEEIRSVTGDMLRRLTREIGARWRDQVQTTIEKMRVVMAIEPKALAGDLDVYFPYGDSLYFDNTPISILVGGRTTQHVMVVNLPPDGSIQWLYPRYAPIDRSGYFDDPEEFDPNDTLSFEAYVGPPFGAEHIVVIETAGPQAALRRAAMRYDQLKNLPEFWEELRLNLSDVEHSIGVHAFYTSDD